MQRENILIVGTAMEKVWVKRYDKGVPESIDYPPITVFELLVQAAKAAPGHCAISFMGTKMSYSLLLDMAERFAGSLARLGVRKGERVALFLPNCPQYIIAYFGILRLGAVAVPNNPLLVDAELLSNLRNCGARAIVTATETALLAKALRVSAAAQIKTVVAADMGGPLTIPGKDGTAALRLSAGPSGTNAFYRFEDLLGSGHPTPVGAPGTDDLAVLMYTGGTTGVPKGVCLTHRNLVANAMQCRCWYPGMQHSKEVFLTVLPVFHVFSMTTSLNLPVLVNSTMVLMPRFDIAGLFEAIDEHQPTLLMGVPAMFYAMAQHLKVGRHRLSSIRFGLSAGDSLPSATRSVFEEISGCRLVEGYGLTEASPAVTCNPISGLNRGIGLPLPDTMCRIVDLDESGRILTPGSTGELCVKGPQVMAGYFGEDPGDSQTLVDGWLHTGDVATMDSEGYFEFIDRKCDIIRVQRTEFLTAYKVFPYEVESVLRQHPAVTDAAVVGVPSQSEGEKVRAFVVLENGSSLSERDLIGFCHQRIAEYSVPSEISFVSELPKNILGKTLRKDLRKASP